VALGRWRSGAAGAARVERPRAGHARPRAARRARPAPLARIAASTGGPNALAEIVRALSGGLSVPVVIVQHMPAMFTRLLRERLSACAALEVAEVHAGAPLDRGRLWIAPGGLHTEISRTRGAPLLRLTAGPEENFCRPSADVLFRSAARVFGDAVLAVVLTGMGHDGLRGCEAIAQAGGTVIAQDEASSVVWGMPGAVARAGLASQVLPLGEIAAALARCGEDGPPAQASAGSGAR
jgi:two-component system chemotaxis response regulator CheB